MNTSHKFSNKFLFTLPLMAFLSVVSHISCCKAYDLEGDDDAGVITMESFTSYMATSATSLAEARTAGETGREQYKEDKRKRDAAKAAAEENLERINKANRGKNKDVTEMNQEARDALNNIRAAFQEKSNRATQETFHYISALTTE